MRSYGGGKLMMFYYVTELLLDCGVGHGGRVTPYAAKMLFSTPVVSVAKQLQRSNLKYHKTTVSLKLVDNGSCVVLRRLVRRMLMRSVPGAKGLRTYVPVLEFFRDSMMARSPGGLK